MGLSTSLYLGPYAVCKVEGPHPSPFDILPNERLAIVRPSGEKDAIYFISNERDTPRDFTPKAPCHLSLDLNPPRETLWFLDRYEAELEALKKGYGNVLVEWGIHYYVW